MIELQNIARELARELMARQVRIVLAESCTGGLAAAALTDISGISDVFCGSAVTYRDATKTAWLNVSPEDLANPEIGAVSEQVAEQMCLGALRQTAEADLAAAVTGHLGPNAPPELDGTIYIGIAVRRTGETTVQRRTLLTPGQSALPLRQTRKIKAAMLLLESVLNAVIV